MTAKQTQLYWRDWAAVRKARPDADRHALHIEALGVDVSSKRLTNAQFDKVLATFRAISQADNLDAQVRQIRQPRARAMHGLMIEAMRCLALYVPDAIDYVETICRARFGTTDLDYLTPEQLTQLRMTLWNRVNARQGLRNKAGHSLHDMYTAARLRCPCAACTKARAGAASAAAQAASEPPDASDPDALEIARQMTQEIPA